GAQLAQSLDRAAERELRATEPFDEVAAPAQAKCLERPQFRVDRAVAAGDPLGADRITCDGAVPLEQQLGERARVGPRTGAESIGERPAPLRRGDRRRPLPREPARTALRLRRLVTTPRPERRP